MIQQPDTQETEQTYQTRGGVAITRTAKATAPEPAIQALISGLDERRGVLLASGYDYPGRYTRWDIGFVDPPLVVSSRSRDFQVKALNTRGVVLVAAIHDAIAQLPSVAAIEREKDGIKGTILQAKGRFAEEQRSRQPSIFSLVRAISEAFRCGDEHLGLYGAFGYDLCFQFEPTQLHLPRGAHQRDLVLYLPDRLLIVDRQKERSYQYEYEFEYQGQRTHGTAHGCRAPI